MKHLVFRTLLGLGVLMVAWLAVVSPATAATTAASARTPIAGEISAGSGELIPIKQEGSVVTYIHPDIHELTGSLEGRVTEFGTLKADVNTGDGTFSADADFVGTALGSAPGTAKIKIRGRLTDFHVIEGRLVVTRGTDGLAGLRATGTFRYVFGEGGSYEGLAHLKR